MNTQSIKGYELRERIGAGGFGAVYRASQTTIGREVAIKIVLPGLANQPEFIRRFESEAQVVARLEHPHIVPLHDYWRDADGAYLVMRWLKGGSLRETLQQGVFDLRSTALLLDQIAGALSLAHRNDIIHRDIKPANILLDEDGNAYLSDFGIAKDLNLNNSHTQPDAIVGSLDYISPEQARSEAITPRTDIYSLGVTLYEVISGHHPFEGFSSIERLYKHINDPLPEITTLDATVSDEINRVLQKATAKNPEHRYTEALAFAADFREAAGLNRTPTNVVELLTQREQDILHLIIEGLSNKEIAQRLTVTLSTVKWYVNQIYAKLGVRSRVQAMVRARELNLLGKNSTAPSVSAIQTADFYPENPYKGLRAFTAADHKEYFGRETLTEKLVKKLGEATELARFLAVVGPSGSGKSSLVKAGLVPAIWKGALPGSEKWFVVEMLPGARPLDELEIALTKVAANHSGSIHEHLARDEYGLTRLASLILPNDGSDLLLVIDQFEEVFTLVEDEAVRQHFLNLIYNAVTAPRSRVRVVMTLRADFYDRPLHYPIFGELVRNRMETILPLSAEELERAILKPAEQVGAKFEAGLAATIVSEVKYQAGALPLLQYALTELFERRSGRTLTREAYQAIGGTVGALAKRADEIYQSLDEAGQEAARQMFLRLVTLGEGTEDTRRRVARSELLAIAADTDLMDDVIDTYAEYRLLSLDNDPAMRTPTVEVAHEAILREWERLRSWLSESREDVRLQRQVLFLSNEWYGARQDISFLLRGSRLEIFEKWMAETKLALTENERAYVDASLIQRTNEQADEQNQQIRELQLAHESVESAHKAATMQKRAANRLRMLVAVLALATLGAFMLSGCALNQEKIAQQNAYEAQIARATSEANAQLSQSLALAAGAQLALSYGNIDLALPLAISANSVVSPTFAQQALYDAAFAPGTRELLTGHTRGLFSVDVSSDGRFAVSVACNCQYESTTGEVILWDLQQGVELRRINRSLDYTFVSVAFSPDARYFAATLEGATAQCAHVSLWDFQTGELVRCFSGHHDLVIRIDYSPDGRYLLSGDASGIAILWDVETGEEVRRFEHGNWINDVRFSPDGSRLLTGTQNAKMWLWDVQTGELLRRFEGHSASVSSVAWSPDGHSAVSTAITRSEIWLWDVETGERLRAFEEYSPIVYSAAFSPDGRYVAVGFADDSVLVIYDVATGSIDQRFYGHMLGIAQLTFSANGWLLTGSKDGTLRLWDIQNSAITQRFSTVNSGWTKSALSHDGTRVLTGSEEDGTLILWDLTTGESIRQFNSSGSITSLSFSPDDNFTLTSGSEGVQLWDNTTGELLRNVRANFSYAEFSPDGNSIVAGSFGSHTVSIIDLNSDEVVQRFNERTENLTIAVFSPDGLAVLSISLDQIASLWDVATGTELQRFQHSDRITAAAFSPNGRYILSGGTNSIIRLWDVTTGAEIRQFVGHSTTITAVTFSPNGQWAASASNDRTVIVWNIATGEIIRRLAVHSDSVTFSADGSSLLIGSITGEAVLWNLEPDLNTLLDWTHANRYIPELSCDQRALYRLEPLCETEAVSPSTTAG